jgi:hypothetical protein
VVGDEIPPRIALLLQRVGVNQSASQVLGVIEDGLEQGVED